MFNNVSPYFPAILALGAVGILAAVALPVQLRRFRDLSRRNAALESRIASMSRENSRQIQIFTRISAIISSSFQRDQLLSQIILVLSDYWPGCRIYILLLKADGSLERVERTVTDESTNWSVPERVARPVLPLLAEPFSGGVSDAWLPLLGLPSSEGYLFSLPFVSEERFRGAMTVVSSVPLESRSRVFLGDIVSFIASADRNVLAIREKDQLSDEFGKSVDPRVRDHLLHGEKAGETLDVSVLFFDIRDFTGLAERQGPDETVSFLNAVFSACELAIREENGFINKFTGDGFMAVFGAPNPDADHARRAIRAALRIQDRIERGIPGTGAISFSFGIGIESGPALAGMIGSAERREYTVIGNTVNTASRIEGLCKTLGARVLVSGNTVRLAGATVAVFRDLGRFLLKGKDAPTAVLEARQLIAPGTVPAEDPFHVDFMKALGTYVSGDFPAALEAFGALCESYPADGACRWYRNRAEARCGKSPSDGAEADAGARWSGYEIMGLK